MFKKTAALLLMVGLVFSMSVTGFAKEAKKSTRVEGRVVRHSSEKSTLTVRIGLGTTQNEKIVHYDASTQWTSKYHGEKKVNTIDASQVGDNDYVICEGMNDDKGEFHATYISKRLSHPAK